MGIVADEDTAGRRRPPCAIVTGGGTGIGRAIALRMAKAGAAVAIVNARSFVAAEETAHEIATKGGRAMAVQADMSRPDDIAAAIDKVVGSLGGIDWLVNNAAVTHQLPFADLDAVQWAMWDDVFAVNVKGVFETCRLAAPHLAKHGDGSILNIGSIAGVTGFGSSIPYAVSKAANHGLTRSLARALAPKVRVNGIAPGAVHTRWWAGNEDKMAKLAGTVALDRVSTPEDIAETAYGIITARSMTGQIVVMDNGQTL